MNIYDKNGIPILPGDTLKVFHYVAAQRREKRYMYKWVEEYFSDKLLKVSHLGRNKEFYLLFLDDKIHDEIEIVQGYGGVKSGQDYRDRKRK